MSTRVRRRVDLYFPHRREMEIAAVGVEAGSQLEARPAAPVSPLVLYGSSVAQGAAELFAYGTAVRVE